MTSADYPAVFRSACQLKTDRANLRLFPNGTVLCDNSPQPLPCLPEQLRRFPIWYMYTPRCCLREQLADSSVSLSCSVIRNLLDGGCIHVPVPCCCPFGRCPQDLDLHKNKRLSVGILLSRMARMCRCNELDTNMACVSTSKATA
jgi:hypothetical protein